ncbi:membrane hypothetical protein [Agrobacterium tumefaciens str. Kerr 14]|uniref:Uncharacterized protein n=1 Tax=Agrobacterium tumefaciens str. Kerr 14 TaxID=1183424 RepID=A0A1S7S9T8_AGRTU|nr:hypothetical protein [Agrobacterium tumefaciens]CUX65203.1 membrane hypothetical protein [Agrobacterium tumefaciens str. Kerr 14]
MKKKRVLEEQIIAVVRQLAYCITQQFSFYNQVIVDIEEGRQQRMSYLDRQILKIAGYAVALGFLAALSLQMEFRLIGWLSLGVTAFILRWMLKDHHYRSDRTEELMICLAAVATGATLGEGIWFELFPSI